MPRAAGAQHAARYARAAGTFQRRPSVQVRRSICSASREDVRLGRRKNSCSKGSARPSSSRAAPRPGPSAGLPVTRGVGVISLERQVRIGAGSLVLRGVLLALFRASVFHRPLRLCRRGARLRRHHRLVRHGTAPREGSLESAIRPLNPHMTAHRVTRCDGQASQLAPRRTARVLRKIWRPQRPQRAQHALEARRRPNL